MTPACEICGRTPCARRAGLYSSWIGAITEERRCYQIGYERARAALRERDAEHRKRLETLSAELETDAKERSEDIKRARKIHEEADAQFHIGGQDALRYAAARVRALLEEAGK